MNKNRERAREQREIDKHFHNNTRERARKRSDCTHASTRCSKFIALMQRQLHAREHNNNNNIHQTATRTSAPLSKKSFHEYSSSAGCLKAPPVMGGIPVTKCDLPCLRHHLPNVSLFLLQSQMRRRKCTRTQAISERQTHLYCCHAFLTLGSGS